MTRHARFVTQGGWISCGLFDYNKNPDGTMKNITLPDGTVTLEGDIKGKFYSITITDSGVSKSVYADSSKTQFIAKNWTDDNNFYQRESYSTDAAGNKTTPYTDFADVFNSTVVVAQHSTLGRNALMEMRRQK